MNQHSIARAARIAVYALATSVAACDSGTIVARGPATSPKAAASAPGAPSPSPSVPVDVPSAPSPPAASPSSPSATPSPAPSSGPVATSCTKSTEPVPGAGGKIPIPGPSGYAVSISVPASDAAPGTTVDLSLCVGSDPPAAVAKSVIPQFLALVGGTPVFYIEVAPYAKAVTFDRSGNAALSATLPAAVFASAGSSGFYGAICDEATCAQTPLTLSIRGVVGPLPLSGNTLAIDTADLMLNAAQRPASGYVAPGHTLLAFLYASPYSPALQYRRVRSENATTR